jgi:serine/threonine protein kinase
MEDKVLSKYHRRDEFLMSSGKKIFIEVKFLNDDVVLKILNNSQDIKSDLLQEIANHNLIGHNDRDHIVKCYGISQDPKTKDYIIVMDCIHGGSLGQYYNDHGLNYNLFQLHGITKGLEVIHQERLVHRDFHSGNILMEANFGYVTDLGLSKPANETDQKKVYGVLSYIAPEVLRNQPYTQASDIYSWGMVAYELLSGLPPYYGLVHDEFLTLKICQGLRPDLNSIQIPQLLKDLIEKCWDADPSKRPKANALWKAIDGWIHENSKGDAENSRFYRQYKEIEKNYKQHKQALSLAMDYSLFLKRYPKEIYTSRLLNFKNLPEPQNSKEVNEQFYKLVDDLEDLRITDPIKFSKELEKKFSELQIKEKSQEILLENEEIDPIEKSGLTNKIFARVWESLKLTMLKIYNYIFLMESKNKYYDANFWTTAIFISIGSIASCEMVGKPRASKFMYLSNPRKRLKARSIKNLARRKVWPKQHTKKHCSK